MLFLGAANRDPRRWTNPDQSTSGATPPATSVGMGLHRCVGQTVPAGAELLLTALANRIERMRSMVNAAKKKCPGQAFR